MAGRTEMKIVFLGHTAIGGSFVVGSHHLARALVHRGHRVTHISPPVSPAHLVSALRDCFARERFSRWMAGGRCLGGVTDVVPFSFLPWNAARNSQWLMRAFSRRMWARPLRGMWSLDLDSADCLIVDEPRFVGIVEQQSRPVLIYRATDLYAAMRGDATIETAERSVCAKADVLVATSEPVAAHLRKISGRAVTVLTNGVEFEHFATPADVLGPLPLLPGTRETRAVYVGSFDRRFGIESVAAASAALPDRHFILAGPGSEAAVTAIARVNVVALGPVDYRYLPALLQQCSVGLLPLAAHAAYTGRSPMKLYEYAAAGLTVAASATDELKRRDLVTLCLAPSEREFPKAVQAAFERAADTGAVRAALEQARVQSWSGKAAALLHLIGEARRGRPASGSAASPQGTVAHEGGVDALGGERTAWK